MSKLQAGDFVFDVVTGRAGIIIRTENIRELDVPPAIAANRDPDYAASLVQVRFDGYTKAIIVSDRSLEKVEEFDDENLTVEISEQDEEE
jgi:hypothetical protein